MHPQNYIHIRAEAARLEAAANLRDTTGLAFVLLVPAHRSSAMQRASTLKSFQPIGLIFQGGVFALIVLGMSLCVYQVLCRLRTCSSLSWLSLPPQLLAHCRMCGPIRRRKDLPTQHGISSLSSSKGLVDLSDLQIQLFQKVMWRTFAGDADKEKQQ